MLIQRYILKMVVILLFAAERQFCTFIELLCISFSWNIHHDQVFSQVVEVIWTSGRVGSVYLLYFLFCVTYIISTGVHSHITIVSRLSTIIGSISNSSYHAVGIQSSVTSYGKAHQMLILAGLRTSMNACIVMARSSLTSTCRGASSCLSKSAETTATDATKARALGVCLGVDVWCHCERLLLGHFVRYQRCLQASTVCSTSCCVLRQLRVHVLSTAALMSVR